MRLLLLLMVLALTAIPELKFSYSFAQVNQQEFTKQTKNKILSNQNLSTKQFKFYDRWIRIAVDESIKYDVPASIKLAQSALESQYGTSSACQVANNFYGIKGIKSKWNINVKDAVYETNTNETLSVYKTPWDSWRANSILLKGKRYHRLAQNCGNSYRCWAVGIAKQGYAVDKEYARKLIHIIERDNLYYADGIENILHDTEPIKFLPDKIVSL